MFFIINIFLIKISETSCEENYFECIRVLETLRFISQNKVNTRRFIGILLAGWLFNKAFKAISIAEN